MGSGPAGCTCACAPEATIGRPIRPILQRCQPRRGKVHSAARLLALAVELVCERSLSLSWWVLTHPAILIEALLSWPRDEWESAGIGGRALFHFQPSRQIYGSWWLTMVGRAIRLGASWTTWSCKVWCTRQRPSLGHEQAKPADPTGGGRGSPLPRMSRPNRPGKELYHPIPGTPGITPGTPIPNGIGMPIGTPMPPMGIPIMPM